MTRDFRILQREGNSIKLLLDNKAYTALLKHIDLKEKVCVINISGFDFTIKINEPLDQLVHELGFLKTIKTSVKEIKSPMPGLVVQVFVVVGQEVSDGEKLLSLEAMKMENILKSPGIGIIKAINVHKGNSVEKNQILIEFE
ncbi:MAG: biotin/lipoyl-binding protein [Saprospiraceae bacterium]|nr:biotin/lipoyl-binding protein [Saprospiraceae bacterium]